MGTACPSRPPLLSLSLSLSPRPACAARTRAFAPTMMQKMRGLCFTCRAPIFLWTPGSPTLHTTNNHDNRQHHHHHHHNNNNNTKTQPWCEFSFTQNPGCATFPPASPAALLLFFLGGGGDERGWRKRPACARPAFPRTHRHPLFASRRASAAAAGLSPRVSAPKQCCPIFFLAVGASAPSRAPPASLFPPPSKAPLFAVCLHCA